MIKILTVCGNGIGSSLMAAGRVRDICKEMGIQAHVESIDFANALAQKADLYVTIKALATQFPEGTNIAVIRSYVNRAQIAEDIKESLINLSK